MLAHQKFADYVSFVSSRCAKIVALIVFAYFVFYTVIVRTFSKK